MGAAWSSPLPTAHVPPRQARLLLEDPGCGDEILGAWDALLPATLARFVARLALLQAFLEGFRTGLFVKDRVRAARPGRLRSQPAVRSVRQRRPMRRLTERIACAPDG